MTTSKHPQSGTNLLQTALAKPYHYRRSGRYYLRLRPQGTAKGFFTLSLRTTDKATAMTIAYAMWVSPDFYLMVVHAFVTMRNDSILSARMALLAAAEADTKLAKAIPKVDLVDRRLAGNGVPWNEACRMAGVTKPQLAKQYLVHIQRFISKDHPTEYKTILKPSATGFAGGFFKSCSVSYGNDDGFRVTAKGLAWLQGKAQEINTAIAERARRKAAERRKK